MIEGSFVASREIACKQIKFDFVVAGGGITGVCAAIAAAREGLKVALVQDRPVLGGNGSSEIRVWMLGATSHMGNNNRWAREGGIIDEILIENQYRNKEGNPVIFDTVLIDKVLAEKNISLFLNTVIYDVNKSDDRHIGFVEAYNSQSQTRYKFTAKYFCDATGDGLLGYMAGASFRMGAEDRSEFNEKFAPDKKVYGEKLGHSILFYVKDAGKPVEYVAPNFALSMEEVVSSINRIQNPNYFQLNQQGCKYWWIEYGGRLDTIADTEEIKYKLWSVVYGVWNYIKNSGKFPDAANLVLEWVGLFPGKRDSRRFVGYTMLSQQDVIEQHFQYDTVAFGGWSIDLHPADGVFSTMSNACNQWHSKGVYAIPYRCYLTPDIDNLFIGGRLISVSHVANGSTRVMATAAAGGQAIGLAVTACIRNNMLPKDFIEADKITILQKMLLRNGCYLPQINLSLADNKLLHARVEASSVMKLSTIPFNGDWLSLEHSTAQMLPVKVGNIPKIKVKVKASKQSMLEVRLQISSKPFNHTPDICLDTLKFSITEGEQFVEIHSEKQIPYDCYLFVCFMVNSDLEIQQSVNRMTGIVSVYNKILPAVSNWGKQEPKEDIGVEAFEFWCPERRPGGHNLAMDITPAIEMFGVSNLKTPVYRPVVSSNAWVADWNEKEAELALDWEKEQEIEEMKLFVDNDPDNALEPIQWGHSENRMPFCLRNIRILDEAGNELACVKDNYQTIITLHFDKKISTKRLRIIMQQPTSNVPISLYGIYII